MAIIAPVVLDRKEHFYCEMNTIRFSQLSRLASKYGFSSVSLLELPVETDASDRLRMWQQKGYYGLMSYMGREPSLFTAPEKLMKGAKYLIIFTAPYPSLPPKPLRKSHGRVARYALGKDYHNVLKKALKKAMKDLLGIVSMPFNYRIFTDAVPLLEREMAKLAGLGFFGKNTMLITPKQGSYYFIAEVLIGGLEIFLDGEFQKEWRGDCGTCSRCIHNCPTGAIVAPYTIDARRCISYLTIEKKGFLETWEREAIGEWVFGCDLCQEVCPFNHMAHKSGTVSFMDNFKGLDAQVRLEALLSLDTKELFVKRFGGTPFMRAGREGIVRNACIVAANTGSRELLSILKRVALKDSSDIVREHADWAIQRLQRKVYCWHPSRIRQ